MEKKREQRKASHSHWAAALAVQGNSFIPLHPSLFSSTSSLPLSLPLSLPQLNFSPSLSLPLPLPPSPSAQYLPSPLPLSLSSISLPPPSIPYPSTFHCHLSFHSPLPHLLFSSFDSPSFLMPVQFALYHGSELNQFHRNHLGCCFFKPV